MIIQDLFEKRTQLMVNCLRYIYQSNSFVTIVNLSERLNVNRKTTDSILNELQKSIRKQSKSKSIRVLFLVAIKTFILIYNMKFIISQSYIK